MHEKQKPTNKTAAAEDKGSLAGDTMHSRTVRLIGEEALKRLRDARVVVFGLGGVGGSCAEALARAGIGHLILVDSDVVDITNLNRQAVAFRSTVGKPKVRVMADRIADIDPEIRVEARQIRAAADNVGDLIPPGSDYVADAIDDVAGKVEVICRAREMGIPVISSMGAGNQLKGEGFAVTTVERTRTCPLAKRLRKELKERGIRGVKAVFSPEEPIRPPEENGGRRSPASISFVPPVAGLLMAGEIVRDIMKMEKNDKQ